MRPLLFVGLLPLAVPGTAGARPFAAGAGQNPGIAIDDVNVGNFAESLSDLELDTNASGAGAVVGAEPFGAKTVRVARFTPRTAPVARTRGARRGFRSTFRAHYELRRRSARIPGRVLPRRGKARTLRLRVRRCGATR